MIHRTKTTIPPSELMDTKWDSLKNDSLVSKANHKVETKCYRDTTIDSLKTIYHNKCAFCERDRGMELQVDHYRPKKPRNNKTNTKYNQPGYYWLTYEWINLIPLCSKCNIKKSNKFPLAGWSETNRVDDHIQNKSYLGYDSNYFHWIQEKEKPLLINPEYEATPEKHFSFRKNGKIIGRTDEGLETINVCDLNRKDLRRERLEIREQYVNNIKSAFDDYAISNDLSELSGELKGIFKSLKNSCDVDAPHSLYHVFLYRYFDYFIDSKLPTNLKGLATKYFEDFKNK